MRKVTSGLLIGTTLATALFAVWLITPAYDPDLADPIASLGLILISLATSGLGVYIATRRTFPAPLRHAWGFLALGSLSGVVAELIWFTLSVILGRNPFPSIADFFYLLAYPLLVVGILSLPYAPINREQRLVLNVDMSIVVLAFGVFLWQLVFADVVAEAGSGLPALVSIAYPLADLLILSGLVSMIQQDVQGVGRRVLLFFIVGIILTIASDVLFAAGATLQAEISFGPLNLMWLTSRWAILVAAVWQATQSQVEMKRMPSFSPLLRTNLTYAAVLVAMVVAFVALGSLFRSNVRLYGTLLGLLGLIMLVLLRQYFVLQDNRRLYRELEQVAVTDALTGLSNRRSFDQALEREVARAQRYLRPLCLLLIDIDNFKLYNDKHGHLRGDALLREFAQLLRTNLRSSDMVARFGGDEFVVILPETDAVVSRSVVEKLGKEVNAALASEDGIGISIGKASFEPDMTASALLDLADRDMYREKASSAAR